MSSMDRAIAVSHNHEDIRAHVGPCKGGRGIVQRCNLSDHSEYLVEIKEEISQAQQKHLRNSPFWTRQALAELRVLDSVMRETLRMNSFTECMYPIPYFSAAFITTPR